MNRFRDQLPATPGEAAAAQPILAPAATVAAAGVSDNERGTAPLGRGAHDEEARMTRVDTHVRALTEERDRLRAACREAFCFFEENAEQPGYGFAVPDDPRDFTPDPGSCTPAEVAAHRAAVEAWNAAGGRPEGWEHPPRSGWNETGTMHFLRAPWGIGTYIYRDPDLCALRDRLAAALTTTEAGNVE